MSISSTYRGMVMVRSHPLIALGKSNLIKKEKDIQKKPGKV